MKTNPLLFITILIYSVINFQANHVFAQSKNNQVFQEKPYTKFQIKKSNQPITPQGDIDSTQCIIGPEPLNIVYKVNGQVVPRLHGSVKSGATIQVTFTTPIGSPDATYSLVSYKSPKGSFSSATAHLQTLYDFDTQTFGGGAHTLTITVPDCFFQVDFVKGCVIEQLGPGNLYSSQNRMISHANGGGYACIDDSPAPNKQTSITDFTSDTDNGLVTLQWNTTEEMRNTNIEVLRSSDNQTFHKIGDVIVTDATQPLTFTDNTALKGSQYYRLSYTNQEGKIETSEAIELSQARINSQSVAEVLQGNLVLYPNPVTDGNFNIVLAVTGKPATLQITDLTGRMLHSTEISGSQSELNLNTKQLGMKPGLYLINLKTNDGLITEKLLVK